MSNLGSVTHDQEIKDALNKAVGSIPLETIFLQLCDDYFDNDDLKEITEFINSRFNQETANEWSRRLHCTI